jgi:Peptidase A4 family
MNNRRSRLLTFSLAACVPVVGLFVAAAPAATASPMASHPTKAQERAIALKLLKKLHVGQHGTAHITTRHVSRISALTQETSTNWSGYADNNTAGSTYTSLSGTWTQPTATCTHTTSLAVWWVGIDGLTSSSVEQDGTGVECSGGTPIYFSWWEMFPTNSIQVVSESLRPGDHIVSTVTKSGTSYALSVTDSTRAGVGFTTNQTCSTCANTSAEWIAEAPSGSAGVEPLTQFTTWSVSGATVHSSTTSGVISSFADDELTMDNNSGQVKASPSALGAGGNSFSVTWHRST